MVMNSIFLWKDGFDVFVPESESIKGHTIGNRKAFYVAYVLFKFPSKYRVCNRILSDEAQMYQ